MKVKQQSGHTLGDPQPVCLWMYACLCEHTAISGSWAGGEAAQLFKRPYVRVFADESGAAEKMKV